MKLNEDNIAGYLWMLACIYGPHILISAGEAVFKVWDDFKKSPDAALAAVWKGAITIFTAFEWYHHAILCVIVLGAFCFTKRK